MKEERLYIVGYMACGKTTFGRALAQALGREFVDLDELVESQEGVPIPQIMAERGEGGFRLAESRALKQTAAMKNVVVACGGGTPCWRDNMEFMTLHGQTLWLVASPGRIAERILAAGPTRPLVAGKSPEELTGFVSSHLLSRQPFYCRAMWRLSGEHLESQKEIDDTVRDFLQKFRPEK